MGRTARLAAVLTAGAAVLASGCGVASADAGTDPAPGPTSTKAAAARSERTPAVRETPRTGHRAAVVRAAVVRAAQATRPAVPAASRRSSAIAVSPAAARRGALSLFDNLTPVLRPVVIGQSGPVVTGRLEVTDPDDDLLSYRVTTAPQHGSVVVDPDGSYTYTADAAVAATGVTDSFTVAVSDADSGFHVHGLLGLLNLLTFGLIGSSGHLTTASVGVTVAPFGAANRPPTAAGSAGSADPVTGVVLGAVVGSDPDGDVLSYATTAAPAKGAVVLDAAAGTFSYTPTSAARQAAAAPGAVPADRLDGFTVTVSDGNGGSAAVAVAVPVAPAVTVPPVDPPVEPPATPVAAFPGAEGFGALATGGRDGRVIYVTTLAAAGPGSLQWAIDQPGARYILFTVSGLIDTQIHLTNGDVTIAGQTSPGGITVRGFVTDETPFQDQDVRAPDDFAENWILQHIRIRPGAGGPSDDGLRLRYTRNAIVDHVSIGNATDEAVEISYSHDITVQNTIIAETVGGHSFYGGVLMNYSNPAHGFALDDISLHHNVFNRIEGRLPEGSRESAAAANSTMNLELSNNLYWDPRFFIALGVDTATAGGAPIYWNLNAVNNYFMTATGFPYGMFDDQIMRVARNRIYLSGNQINLYPGRADYELFYCCNDYPALSHAEVASLVAAQAAQKLPARNPFPTITYTPTAQLRTVLLNTVGAWPRDPMDRRLMQSVATDTIATAPPDTNPAGDALLPAFPGAAPSAPVDSDLDGMPDAWESARGLNPSVANANGRTLSAAGYTDLEVYLQELSSARIAGWT